MKKPLTVRDMAWRRGLAVHKAKRGGWYVTFVGAPWGGVLYCTHDWARIELFIKRMPIIIKRSECG